MNSPSFDLRLVAPFLVLAEELHLGRAAVRLGMAQPALSQQIGRLERQLGTALLDRAHRQLTLTPAGSRFLVESRAIVTRAARVEEELRGGAGELRIAIGEAAYPRFRHILTSFTDAHPSIAVSLFEGVPSAGVRELVDGEVDVAFEVPEGVPAGMSFAGVSRTAFGVACAASHPLASRAAASWRDLDGERYFAAPPGTFDGYNASVRNALRRAGAHPVEVVGPPVNRALYLIPAIAAGQAVLISPQYPFDPLPPDLAWVPLAPRQDMELGVVWNDHDPVAAVRGFVTWARRAVVEPV